MWRNVRMFHLTTPVMPTLYGQCYMQIDKASTNMQILSWHRYFDASKKIRISRVRCVISVIFVDSYLHRDTIQTLPQAIDKRNRKRRERVDDGAANGHGVTCACAKRDAPVAHRISGPVKRDENSNWYAPKCSENEREFWMIIGNAREVSVDERHVRLLRRVLSNLTWLFLILCISIYFCLGRCLIIIYI